MRGVIASVRSTLAVFEPCASMALFGASDMANMKNAHKYVYASRITILISADGQVMGLGLMHEARLETRKLPAIILEDAPPVVAKRLHQLRLLGMRFVDLFLRRPRSQAEGIEQ